MKNQIYIIDRMKKIKNIRTYSEKKKILIKSKLKRIKLDKTIKKYIIKNGIIQQQKYNLLLDVIYKQLNLNIILINLEMNII